MASEIQIINRALSKLGTDRIGARSETSKPAREADACYDHVRDAELRLNTWRFSVKRASLSALTTTPAFQFAREFQLPTDCLRVIQVGEFYAASLSDYRSGDESPFALEGRKILTDLTAPLALRYVRRVGDTDAQDMDSAFVEALACKLAFEMCEAITGSTGKQDSLAQQHKAAVDGAQLANAIEVPPAVLADDSWIAGRL